MNPRSAEDAAEREILDRFREYRRTRDRGLRNQLLEEHLDFARRLARRFSHRSEPVEDLEQVAMLGMLKAVERFEPERGLPFHAFAVPTVLGELRRHFRDRGWMVRVPRRMQDLHLRLDPLIAELAQRLGRSPTTAELAEAADVQEEDVLEAMDAGNYYRPASLDATATSAGPRIASESRIGVVDREFGSVENRALLLELLDRLSAREQKILYLRYFEEMTQSEIAAEVGISQMHVSRLLARGLALLGCAHSEVDG